MRDYHDYLLCSFGILYIKRAKYLKSLFKTLCLRIWHLNEMKHLNYSNCWNKKLTLRLMILVCLFVCIVICKTQWHNKGNMVTSLALVEEDLRCPLYIISGTRIKEEESPTFRRQLLYLKQMKRIKIPRRDSNRKRQGVSNTN